MTDSPAPMPAPLIQQRPVDEIFALLDAGTVSIYEAAYGLKYSMQALDENKAVDVYQRIEAAILGAEGNVNGVPLTTVDSLIELGQKYLPERYRIIAYQTARDLITETYLTRYMKQASPSEIYPGAAAAAIIDAAEKLLPDDKERAAILTPDLQQILNISILTAENPAYQNNTKVMMQAAVAAGYIVNALPGMEGYKDEHMTVSSGPVGYIGAKPSLGVALTRVFNASGTMLVNAGGRVDYLGNFDSDLRAARDLAQACERFLADITPSSYDAVAAPDKPGEMALEA